MAQAGVNGAGNTNQNRVKLKAEITRIEDEIVTTKARLAFLEQQLEEKKDLSSPVRKAPVELLSAVFEFCNGEVWESSIRLAGVCKQWRRTVLSTPLAWAHIQLYHKPPTEILAVYLERSKPSHLHLTLPPYDFFDPYCRNLGELLKTFSDRITCLRAGIVWFRGISLPSVRHVQVRGSISSSEFPFRGNPSLRYMEACFGHTYLIDSFSAVRIQHLHVWVVVSDYWVEAVRHLGPALVALKIRIHRHDSPSSTETFDLPHLRYLEIYSALRAYNRWEFKASTPLLQSHVPLGIMDGNETLYYHTEVDVGNVTHLRIDERESLSLAPYHKLLYLCLGFRPVDILEQLQMDDRLCPSLARIEYRDEEEHMKQRESLADGEVVMAEVIMTIDRGHLATPAQISVVRIPPISPWSIQFPNQIEETCGAHVECVDWET